MTQNATPSEHPHRTHPTMAPSRPAQPVCGAHPVLFAHRNPQCPKIMSGPNPVLLVYGRREGRVACPGHVQNIRCSYVMATQNGMTRRAEQCHQGLRNHRLLDAGTRLGRSWLNNKAPRLSIASDECVS